MKNKDFREIQVSSSLLVVIFLGVLALGVFIFLLGVSVGKKQSALSAPTRIVTQQIAEPVKEPPPVKTTAAEAASETQTADPKTTAAKPQPKETSTPPAAPPKAAATKSNAPARRGLYYVQVLAVTDRAQAQAAADRYRRQGYTVIIVDPPPGEANYKVRLGGYASRDRANELRTKLNAEAGGKTDFWIVQY
ncbi:MAG TPA: hypothetical protein ENO03_01560 [Candidatus Aminicenantes bacterium]|nr:hypothetical protein [Candidatus Aminicenantes bacterium]